LLCRPVRIALVLLWMLVHCTWTAVPVSAQGQRLVLAFYYAWYDDNTWGPDKMSDMPLTPYCSADRATVERHVREARGAGINALVQSWYGPASNPTERNLALLLDVAQQSGLQAGVDFEVGSPYMPTLQSLIDGLVHLIGVHAQHPAYLRYKGRPVIFFWQQQRLSAAQWASIRAQVDPDHSTIWIADSDNAMWLDVFDGLHLYSITWAINTNPLYTATKMRKRVDQYVAERGVERYWIATAMPGYDDRHVEGRAHPYVYPRSPDYYWSTWDAAIASGPEMVIITSYNEWREGTMIEPSVTYGTTYLDLTHELAAAYKGNVAPVPAAATRALPTAISTPVPTPTISPTCTPMPTSTETPRPTATPTAAATATATETVSPTATSTPTPSPMPTVTAVRPTATATRTPAATRTFAVAHTYRATETSTPFVTATAAAARAQSELPTRPLCLGAGLLPVSLVGLALWRTIEFKDRRE
jgi:hypothetical protein